MTFKNLKKIIIIPIVVIILFNVICPTIIAADDNGGTEAIPIDDAEFEAFSDDGILSLDGIVRYFDMVY